MDKLYFYSKKVGPIIHMRLIETIDTGTITKSNLDELVNNLSRFIISSDDVPKKIQSCGLCSVIQKSNGNAELFISYPQKKLFLDNIFEVTYNPLSNNIFEVKFIIDGFWKRFDFQMNKLFNKENFTYNDLIKAFTN